MATPVGHYLLGLCITQIFARNSTEQKRGLWLGAVACTPDLDVLPGLLVGNLSQFHHGGSHSLLAAATFAISAILIGPRKVWPRVFYSFVLVFCLYASHIFLDLLTLDTSAPYGVPLYWPWIQRSYQSPWLLLPNVHHTRAPVFGTYNLVLAIREGLLFLPLIGLVLCLRVSRWPWTAKAGWLYGGWFLLAVWASSFPAR